MDLCQMNEVDFFLSGFKPAVRVHCNFKCVNLETYPSIVVDDGLYTIYFQNGQKKKDHLYRVQEVENKFEVFGETFGYPPAAIKGFKEDFQKDFFVSYYGLSFVSYKHTISEDLLWLKKTYPIPKDYPGFIAIENIALGQTHYFKYEDNIFITSSPEDPLSESKQLLTNYKF